MNTVLLFGGRSFLGGHICRVLVDRGYRVLLHSRSSGTFKNLPGVAPGPQVEIATCDFTEIARLRELMGRSSMVIHAAIPYFIQSIGQRDAVRDGLADFELTLGLLAASKIRKAVFVSVSGLADKAIGTHGPAPGPPTGRLWCNHAAKLSAERMIMRHVEDGLPAAIVNPAMCVGAFDTKPSTGEFFRFFARSPFLFMADAPLDMVDVEDAALGAVLAMERGTCGQRYLLSGTRTTVGDLMRRIKQLEGRPMPRLHLPRAVAVGAALLSESLNLVLRRPKPAVPLMGIELIEQGATQLNCGKAAGELGFATGDAWAAVDRAHRWYKANQLM